MDWWSLAAGAPGESIVLLMVVVLNGVGSTRKDGAGTMSRKEDDAEKRCREFSDENSQKYYQSQLRISNLVFSWGSLRIFVGATSFFAEGPPEIRRLCVNRIGYECVKLRIFLVERTGREFREVGGGKSTNYEN
jgi:hypothetical protein